MLLSSLFICLGFAILIFGADWLVDGSSALAKKYHVSDLVIGLTIVAFGTSAPEMVVNIISSAGGHSDLVVGNIIGSNNFNLFVILGLSALIMPISVQSSTAWKEIPISLFAAVLFLLLGNDFFMGKNASFTRIDASIFFVFFVLFLYYVFQQMKKEPSVTSDCTPLSMFKIVSLIVLGLAGLIVGARLVVNHSIRVAEWLGVSEKIIGLTIVAAGTSLPELVTSVVAAFKKNSDIAIGNVIGSNIFNILFILSVSFFIHPITYNPLFNIDVCLLMGGTLLLLLFMLSGKKYKLDRWEGMILLCIFIAYTVHLIAKE